MAATRHCDIPTPLPGHVFGPFGYFHITASPSPVVFWTVKAPFWCTLVAPRPDKEPAFFAPGIHPAGVPGRLVATSYYRLFGYFPLFQITAGSSPSPSPVVFWTAKAPFCYTFLAPRPEKEPALFAPGIHPAGVPGR